MTTKAKRDRLLAKPALVFMRCSSGSGGGNTGIVAERRETQRTESGTHRLLREDKGSCDGTRYETRCGGMILGRIFFYLDWRRERRNTISISPVTPAKMRMRMRTR